MKCFLSQLVALHSETVRPRKHPEKATLKRFLLHHVTDDVSGADPGGCARRRNVALFVKVWSHRLTNTRGRIIKQIRRVGGGMRDYREPSILYINRVDARPSEEGGAIF